MRSSNDPDLPRLPATSLARRRFLAIAAAAMVPARLRSGAESPGPPRKMKIDLSCGALGIGAGLRETLDLAARHGFEAFDPPAEELASLPPADLEKLLADMKARGVVFGAVGLPVDFRGEEKKFAEDLEKLPPLAAGLKRAGVDRMGTWISPCHATRTYLKNFQLHVDRLGRVAAALRAQGVRLGLEYVAPRTSWTRARFPFIHTMAEMKDLIGALGSDGVGLVLDSWHWYTARETVEDLLTLSAKDVVAVDLNDAPAGKPIDEQLDGKRDLPGATGVIDLAGFLGALRRIGYDGPVRAEPFREDLARMPRDEAVAAAAAALRKSFLLIA
jgi:sugar phosphate isomerase/epimerase